MFQFLSFSWPPANAADSTVVGLQIVRRDEVEDDGGVRGGAARLQVARIQVARLVARLQLAGCMLQG